MDDNLISKSGPPSFDADNYMDWRKRFKAFLMRFDGAHLCLDGDIPIGGAALATWTTRNDKAYSYLVQATEKHPIAKTIVLNIDSVVAKTILSELDARFNILDQSVIQSELTNFNSMKCLLTETGELFINRLNSAKSKLHHYNIELSDDIHLLARLKDGLSSNPRYSILAGALSVACNLTFINACNQVISFDRRNPFTPVAVSTVADSIAPSGLTETANFVKEKKFKRQKLRGKKRVRSDSDSDSDDDRSRICVFCRKDNHPPEKCFNKDKLMRRWKGIIKKYDKPHSVTISADRITSDNEHDY